MNKFGRKSKSKPKINPKPKPKSKINPKPKIKTIKINFSWDDSSVNTSCRTNTSDDEIKADWLYDTWEFNLLTKRGKKEKVSTESENLLVIHEQRQKQDSPVPQLDNSSASIITLRSTETPTLPRKIFRQSQNDTFSRQSRKKSKPKSKPLKTKIDNCHFSQHFDETSPNLEIYSFSRSARSFSHTRERSFVETFSKQKNHRRRGKHRKQKGVRMLTSSIKWRKK